MKLHHKPIAITSFVCAMIVMATATFAWVQESSLLSGITIHSENTSTEILLSTNGTDFSNSATISKEVTLKPVSCANGKFYDEDGEQVNTDDYRLKFQLWAKSSEHCTLKMRLETDDGMPIKALTDYGGVYRIIGTEAVVLGDCETYMTPFTVCIYIDGTLYNGEETGTVNIILESEE